jgi:type IV pilus assembly protein PilV
MTFQASVHASQRNRQSGVGLIEVMVAVLVLSIGFLGIAALQALSLSTNNSAMARSLATIDSYAIIDAMRADQTNALANKYDGTVKGGSCPATAATLASTELHNWCGQLATDLGSTNSTQGTIACVQATGTCTVTIAFDDSRASNAGVTTASQQTQPVSIITKAML